MTYQIGFFKYFFIPYFNLLYLTGQTSEFDVDIAIKYCGVSPFADVHLANYDWGSVPGLCAVVGHEISGVVSRWKALPTFEVSEKSVFLLTVLHFWRVGSEVADLSVGDHVGVGYFIDSCLECQFCKDNQVS